MLGALLHAGVDPELFRQTIAALGVDAHIQIERVNRSGISSTRVRVVTAENAQDDTHLVLEGHSHGHAHDSHQTHSHQHSHEAKTQKAGTHKHDHHHSHAHGRSLSEIRELISRARIEPASRTIALRAFHLLGEAEAKIHNIPVEQIHFHEVGAVDAIVDIVCAAAGCISLGVDRWVCSPLNVGGGTVKCAHGIFPVPAPATTELLKGAPVYSSGVQAELVTPTGATLMATLADEFGWMPAMRVEVIGYGAGKKEFPFPNLLRVCVGREL